MDGWAWRTEELPGQHVGVADDRLHQPAVGRAVSAQPGRGHVNRAIEHSRRTIIERVGERNRRMLVGEPVVAQGQGAEKRRCVRQWQNR